MSRFRENEDRSQSIVFTFEDGRSMSGNAQAFLGCDISSLFSLHAQIGEFCVPELTTYHPISPLGAIIVGSSNQGKY